MVGRVYSRSSWWSLLICGGLQTWLRSPCLGISLSVSLSLSLFPLANLFELSRALHEKEARPKRGLTRFQFFLIVLTTSFSFHTVPGYFFPSLSALSFVCWIWKDSVTAQQLGSGWIGFGLGSFSVDWTLFSAALITPIFSLVNLLVGVVLANHILTPIAYWSNLYEAKRFPVFSTRLFDASGHPYNVSRILDENNLQFNEQGYNSYSKIYLSIRNVVTWGLSFASIPATLCHVFLFHGRSIWQETNEAFQDKRSDVHSRLMKKYDSIPQWWFNTLLVLMVAVSIVACEGFGRQLQLPFWGVLLACVLAFTYTFPMGVITATSNMVPVGISEVTLLIISYTYPGRPIANMVFGTYGFISALQAIAFLQDFKLGQYMKIPPRSMFIVQLASTVISSAINLGTSWWLLTTVDNICHPEMLPTGSPWLCPGSDSEYSASILWGVVGPRRLFGQLGLYSKLNMFFLIGLLAPVPVWALSLVYPEKKWLRLVNIPIILAGGAQVMPPFRMAYNWTFFAVGFFFSFYVYRRFKAWWARHVYVLCAGLDAGIILLGLLSYFAVQLKDVYGVNWWGLAVDDHCPLAHCPTAPGIVVDGCPLH